MSGERQWTLDAYGEHFRLASEARRIQLVYLFDPFVAIDASSIEPLPHQMEAVYEELLPRQPLRFLRASAQIGTESEKSVSGDDDPVPPDPKKPTTQEPGLPKRFYGRVRLDPVRAIRDLEAILDNIVNHLANAKDGDVTLTLEVEASSDGFDDRVQRTVREDATQLGFDSQPEFED